MSSSARQSFNWTPVWEWIQKSGAILTVATIAVFGFWGGHFLLPGQEHVEAETEEVEVQPSVETHQITLPQGKFDAAKLVCAIIEESEFQAHKAIPGTVTYDSTKKVELRATVEGVVKQTLVRPNQHVEQGEPLLILTGPDIGSARSEISKCESTVDLLETEYQWMVETHANIKSLLAMLNQSPSSKQIKSRFENRKLGEHRNEILTAYSELNLAQQLTQRTQRLVSQGAISGREAQERRSSLEVASAKFNSIREEMTFQTSQQLTQAKAKLDAEKKQLAICKERLSAMLGPDVDGSPDADEPELTLDTAKQASANLVTTCGVSEFVLKAPRSGQVVNLPAVQSSRFEPGEVMAVIADTSDVWIEAQVSQRDWHSVTLKPDQVLTVRIPALPEEEFSAVVKHISAAVSKETMAIPLVAELQNPDGKFRPGMSVWVEMPISKNRLAIVVPEGAVQRSGQDAFVFLQTGGDSFEKRDVVVGEESEDEIEITSGLNKGDNVVVEGAFFLKSEMLLAEEE